MVAAVGEVAREVDHLLDGRAVHLARTQRLGLVFHRRYHQQHELVLVAQLDCRALGHRGSSLGVWISGRLTSPAGDAGLQAP